MPGDVLGASADIDECGSGLEGTAEDLDSDFPAGGGVGAHSIPFRSDT